jgi:hypothetical protein
MRIALSATFYLSAVALSAQVGPFPSTSVSLDAINQQVVTVPAGANPTIFNITVDPKPTGQDVLDAIVGDPSVVISLILPNGSEVTASNAAANGFTFNSYTSDGGTSMDALSPFLLAGAHTTIQFPTPAPPGVYGVKANASSAQSDTAMMVLYYPSSTVSMGAITDASTYRQGDLIILSGFVFDAQTPIQNATVTAVAGAFLPVSGSIGNYQLASTTQLTPTLYLDRGCGRRRF